ncbi:hypothetical protein [Pseudomonas viridiflava]|uniref:hypothetical protein n=1 Tax=Pseudomonas viridiflava TaxID=33069 RepID=UPI000F05EF3F|nr:hypothetical protein [Pseudomonas viridiflava]
MYPQTSSEILSPALRVLSIGALILGLSGCDLVGILAKEVAVSATSHRGWDTFTFKGQLPAEFGIDAIAFYVPNEPDKPSCQTPSFEPGKTITRRHTQQYTAEIQAQPQAFSFEIPLSYYKGLCGMKLGRVKLEINARYGKEKWQNTYADGYLQVQRKADSHSHDFTAAGELELNALCSFMFQESKMRTGIAKLMSCRGAIANLPTNKLANKTATLIIESNPIEKPSMRNRWIKTEAGWKPCQPTEKSNRCQVPPIFKTFEMDGQICTVYPNCKEQ